MLDTLVWEKGASKLLWGQQPSRLSAAVVLAARVEECRSLLTKGGAPQVTLWPVELQKMTRCTEEDIEDLAYFLIKLNNEQPHLAAPKEEEAEDVDESIFGGKAQPVMTSEEFDNHIIRLIQEGKLPMPNSDEEFEQLLQMKEVSGLLHEGLVEPRKPDAKQLSPAKVEPKADAEVPKDLPFKARENNEPVKQQPQALQPHPAPDKQKTSSKKTKENNPKPKMAAPPKATSEVLGAKQMDFNRAPA
jgi:hypothetical protein